MLALSVTELASSMDRCTQSSVTCSQQILDGIGESYSRTNDRTRLCTHTCSHVRADDCSPKSSDSNPPASWSEKVIWSSSCGLTIFDELINTCWWWNCCWSIIHPSIHRLQYNIYIPQHGKGLMRGRSSWLLVVVVVDVFIFNFMHACGSFSRFQLWNI